MSCNECINQGHPERCADVGCDEPHSKATMAVIIMGTLCAGLFILFVLGRIYTAEYRAANPPGYALTPDPEITGDDSHLKFANTYKGRKR